MQPPAPPPPVTLEQFNQDIDSFYAYIRGRDDYINNQSNQNDIDNIIENIYGIKTVVGGNPEYEMLIASVRVSAPQVADDRLQASIVTAKTSLVNKDIININMLLQGKPILLERQRNIGGGIIRELTDKVLELLPGGGGKSRKTSNKKRPTARRRRSSKARKARRSRKARKSRTTRRR